MPDLFRLSDVDGSVRLVVSIDPEPGVGTVDSVTAADGTIVVAGTAADPTVAVGEIGAAQIGSGAATSGEVLQADGAGGSAWAPSTGGVSVLDYASITHNVAAGGGLVNSNSFAVTAGEILEVQFFCQEVDADFSAHGPIGVLMNIDSGPAGLLGTVFSAAVADYRGPFYAAQRVTGLSAGSHAVEITSTGTGTFSAGDGLGGDRSPMYVQVLKLG